MILLQRDDIEEIKKDKTNIVKILDKKARRVFAKKELSMTDEEINEIEEGELSITDEDVNEVEEKELLIEVLSD
jgi:site-specific DNA-methyltransferase (cytosine-N4-specific)